MADDSAKVAVRKAAARSRVTNGSSLGAMDGRSRWARRLRDLIELYSNDLGGDEGLSSMQRSIIRRAATLTVELERAEDGFATTGSADAAALHAYQTTANSLRRILETLGLQGKHVPKQAAEVQRSIEGWKAVRSVQKGMDDTSMAIAFGPADYDKARRLLFAMNKHINEDGALPAELAAIAVKLGLAELVEGDE